MSEHTKECSIFSKTDEKRVYPCGHEGPAKWSTIFFGHEYEVRDETLANPPKCGQCMLDEIKPLLGQCVKCGAPIFPQTSCIVYDYGLCCLGTECGPGPMFAMPGIWDGSQFVDGITAGTVKTVDVSGSSRRRRSVMGD